MTTSSTDLFRQALSHAESGDHRQAQELLETLHRRADQKTARSLHLLAALHESQRNLAVASQLTEEAAGLTNNDQQAAQLLVRAADLTYLQQSDTQSDRERIASLLALSVARDPSSSNGNARHKLCESLLATQDYEKLFINAVELLEINPSDRAWACIWAATACYFLNRKPQGQDYLDKVLTEPSGLDDRQLYRVLVLAIEYGLLDRAEAILAWMEAQQRSANYCREFQAKIARERGDNHRVLEILSDNYVANVTHEPSRQRLLALRGKCLDSIGEYSDAHQCFVAMNNIARDQWRGKTDPDQLRKLERIVPEVARLAKKPVSQSNDYLPTFLVGFPRSGTTLLESILDTHSRIQTLSEKDAIASIVGRIRTLGLAYPRDLAKLDTTTIAALRQQYYDFQLQFIKGLPITKVIVDKLPLNMLHIPLLQLLFPKAKYILALRHPADVCISCFQQDFQLNKEMIHFTDFTGSFERYRDIFRLFELYKNEFELPIHSVRYEDLIDDLEPIAIGLFNFLGVEPEDRYKNFFQLNRDRLVNTPSRAQITKPLYRSSKNRWTNYAEFVCPLRSIIEEVANGYGYSLDECLQR